MFHSQKMDAVQRFFRSTPGWSTLKNGLWLTVLRSPRDGGRSTLCHDLREKRPEIPKRSTSDAPEPSGAFQVWRLELRGDLVRPGVLGSPGCGGYWLPSKGIAVAMKHVKMITIKSYQNYQIYKPYRILDDFIIIQIIGYIYSKNFSHWINWMILG